MFFNIYAFLRKDFAKASTNSPTKCLQHSFDIYVLLPSNKEETLGQCTVTGGLFRSKNKYATGNP